MRLLALAVCWLVATWALCNSAAAELAEINYPQLVAEQGASLPSGAGVVVAQSEANAGGGYYPDPNDPEFHNPDKTFIPASGAFSPSWHATQVGMRFYGNMSSVGHGISQIHTYRAEHWETGYLHIGQGFLPEDTPIRIANHSWISQDDVLEKLHRTDWLTDTDDLIQTVGLNQPGTGLNGIVDQFSSAFNVIVVGQLDGSHFSGTNALSPIYTAGRTRPHLVAPPIVSSFSAPLTAGTAAMLIELARDNPALSHGTIASSVGRNNWTLQHGETSEVIRAVLLAGANRQAEFGTPPGSATYTPVPGTPGQPRNGLDLHYGAGLLDAYRSYHVMAAGEQESVQAGNAAGIGHYGFDYHSLLFNSTTDATYRFSVEHSQREFAASLNWNLKLDQRPLGGMIQFTPVLRNLNLSLYDVTGGQPRETVRLSNSTTDTNENIYVSDLAPGDYELVVSGAGTFPYTIDYGLAWRFAPEDPHPGDVNLDGMVSLLDAYTIKSHWQQPIRALWTDGDMNGDGRVDGLDLAIFMANFGYPEPAPMAAASPAPAVVPTIVTGPMGPIAVPEPASAYLLAIGGIATAAIYLGRRRK